MSPEAVQKPKFISGCQTKSSSRRDITRNPPALEKRSCHESRTVLSRPGHSSNSRRSRRADPSKGGKPSGVEAYEVVTIEGGRRSAEYGASIVMKAIEPWALVAAFVASGTKGVSSCVYPAMILRRINAAPSYSGHSHLIILTVPQYCARADAGIGDEDRIIRNSVWHARGARGLRRRESGHSSPPCSVCGVPVRFRPYSQTIDAQKQPIRQNAALSLHYYPDVYDEGDQVDDTATCLTVNMVARTTYGTLR